MAIVSERASADASDLAPESRVSFLTIIVYPAEIWLQLRIIIITSFRQQFSSPLKQFAIICNTQENTLVGKKRKIRKGGPAGEGYLAQFLGKCRVNKQ